MNGVTYDPPSVPTLLQILNGNMGLLPNGTTYFLPRNKTIELSIPSGASGGEVCISQFSTQLNSYTLIVLSASSSFTRGESTTILASHTAHPAESRQAVADALGGHRPRRVHVSHTLSDVDQGGPLRKASMLGPEERPEVLI